MQARDGRTFVASVSVVNLHAPRVGLSAFKNAGKALERRALRGRLAAATPGGWRPGVMSMCTVSTGWTLSIVVLLTVNTSYLMTADQLISSLITYE